MSKVFAIHQFEPRPGVSAQDFEQLVSDAASAMQRQDDWKIYVLKGDRGDQKGNYLLIHEFDSVDTRNRYFPTEGGAPSEVAQQILSVPAALAERFQKIMNTVPNAAYTDYVVIND